jgi:hypothetical protein
MITIKVIYSSDGKPAKDKRVSASTSSYSQDQYTNSQGDVDFDLTPGDGKVWVDGSVVHQGYLEGRVSVYI